MYISTTIWFSRQTELYISTTIWFSRQTELYISTTIWFSRQTELYISTTIWFSQQTQLYISTTIWFSRQTELYISTTIWFSQQTQLYISTTIWFSRQTELYVSTTIWFSRQTELYRSTTIWFSRQTELKLQYGFLDRLNCIYQLQYGFLNRLNCIYQLRYGFRVKHSTNHALLGLTEKIRESLDSGKFACGVFELKKAFDTVDHSILLKKMEHYGIKGLANNWFRYLTGWPQYTSVNGFDSEYRDMKYGVPQGSVLGPLLFLIYINHLHNAIKFSTVHQFEDDTNLLISNESIKTVQTQINLDLKYFVKWLNANEVSPNASKTKVLIFRHQIKPIMYRKKISDKLNPWDVLGRDYEVAVLGI